MIRLPAAPVAAGASSSSSSGRGSTPADTYVLIDLEHAGKPIQGWDVLGMVIVFAAGWSC